jgi:Right handed beta helix region
MSKVRFTLNVLAAVVFTVAVSSMAHAQATRTWVSGVGDDANPCSRTAPCKTFAGAISKTAAGGEINAIDSGGFGAVTTTKGITIDGNATHAGVLAAGTTGIIVNITAAGTGAQAGNDIVTLRNLSINGAGTGTRGIAILSSVANTQVFIENCQISGFRATGGGDNGKGIIDRRTAAGSKLHVSDTVIRANLVHGVQIGDATGIVSTVDATFDNVNIQGNGVAGMFLGGGSNVSVRGSVITGNGGSGIQSSEQAGGTTETEVTDTVLSHNVTGIFAGSGASVVRVSRVTITDCGTGVNASGGAFVSFGDNNIVGNGAGNALPAAIGQQ